MFAKIRRFAAMPRSQRRLLVEAWLALASMRISLGCLPYRKTVSMQAWLRRRFEDERSAVPGAICAVPVAIVRASRYVPGATCLPQALAAQVLLARRGVDSDLRLGVAHGDDGKLLAHAWLESQGEVILGKVHPEVYQPLAGPPLSTPAASRDSC